MLGAIPCPHITALDQTKFQQQYNDELEHRNRIVSLLFIFIILYFIFIKNLVCPYFYFSTVYLNSIDLFCLFISKI